MSTFLKWVANLSRLCAGVCVYVCIVSLAQCVTISRVVGGVTGMDCRDVAAPKRGKLLEDNTVLLF